MIFRLVWCNSNRKRETAESGYSFVLSRRISIQSGWNFKNPSPQTIWFYLPPLKFSWGARYSEPEPLCQGQDKVSLCEPLLSYKIRCPALWYRYQLRSQRIYFPRHRLFLPPHDVWCCWVIKVIEKGSDVRVFASFTCTYLVLRGSFKAALEYNNLK